MSDLESALERFGQNLDENQVIPTEDDFEIENDDSEDVMLRLDAIDNITSFVDNNARSELCVEVEGKPHFRTPIGDIPAYGKIIKSFKVSDGGGKFRSVLKDWVNRTGAGIIPADIANIPNQVSYIDGFDIIEFSGAKYFADKTYDASDVDVISFCDMIIQALNTTGSFAGSLMTKVEGNGFEFKTLAFSKRDLSNILYTFLEFNPSLVVKEKDLFLVIS